MSCFVVELGPSLIFVDCSAQRTASLTDLSTCDIVLSNNLAGVLSFSNNSYGICWSHIYRESVFFVLFSSVLTRIIPRPCFIFSEKEPRYVCPFLYVIKPSPSSIPFFH